MSSDLLRSEIKTIQSEYKEILIHIRKNFDDKMEIKMISDELRVFWYTHRNTVDLFLSYLPKAVNTYVFTGAGFIGVNDNEHYPFVTVGKKHIIDDNLIKFLDGLACSSNDQSNFVAEMSRYATQIIIDHIEILENYSDYFTIIPVRSFLPDHIKTIQTIAQQLFCSLFQQNIKTINEFFQRYHTIEEVFNDIKPELTELIIFSEDDNITDSIQDKFNRYFDNNKNRFDDSNEIFIFYIAIYGFISQAVDVLLSCQPYNVIPYIRSPICSHYMFFLAPTFLSTIKKDEQALFDNKMKLMFGAHILHDSFDLNKIRNIDFNKYIKVLDEIDFNLDEKILENEKLSSPIKQPVYEIVKHELELLYKNL